MVEEIKMDPIVASAPGKLMLFGEHAVLYAQPCIVSAVNLRMRVKVKTDRSSRVSVLSILSPEQFVVDIPYILNNDLFPDEVKFILCCSKRT